MKTILPIFLIALFAIPSLLTACDEQNVSVTDGPTLRGDGKYDVTVRICVGLNSALGSTDNLSLSFGGTTVSSISCGGAPSYSLQYDGGGNPNVCDGSSSFAASTTVSGGNVSISGTTGIEFLTSAAGAYTPDFPGSVCGAIGDQAAIGAQPFGACADAPAFEDVDGVDSQFGICFSTTMVLDGYPTSLSASGFESVATCDEEISFAPLPIELLGFSATAIGNDNLIKWSTATEVNSSHFLVERSMDGVSFQVAGAVQSVGNSTVNQYYEFVDQNVSNQAVFYYRLKQVDFDDSYQFTDVVSVNRNFSSDIVLASGSLIGSTLKVGIKSDEPQSVDLYIVAMDGRVHSTSTAQVGIGYSTLDLDLDIIEPGVYCLVTVMDGHSITKKFVKE